MNTRKAAFLLLFMFAVNLTSQMVLAGPLDDLQPGHWYEVPNSKIRPHLPSPIPPNGSGPNSIITAWNGGFFDTARNRYVVMGGGHGDYAGNEIYAFSVDSLKWSRIWGPTPNEFIPPQPATFGETYSNGDPRARHTYDGVEYLPNVDKYFIQGGSLWSGSGGFGIWTWFFDPAKSAWEKRADISVCYSGHAGPFTAYDPKTGTVYNHKYSRLCEYDPVLNKWTRRGSYGPGISPKGTSVFDPKRKQFCIIGDGATRCYDMNRTDNDIPLLTIGTTGDKTAETANFPGVEYDPNSDRIIAWVGGTHVYALDLTTRVWRKIPPAPTNSVTPSDPTHNGTHSRWRYVPSKNVFVVVNSIDQNLFAYKLSAGTGTLPPVPITTAPNSPSNLRLAGVASPPPPSDTTPPSVPGGLIAQPISSSEIKLTWASSTDNVGVAGYKIFRNGAQIGTVTATSYQNTGLASSTTYKFSVAAYDGSGNQSTQSAAVSATTKTEGLPPPPEPPTGPINIPNRQWVALKLPRTKPIGIDGAKHISCAQNPRNERIYCVGGDYNGGSYVDQVFSFSVKEKLANPSDPLSGLRLEFPRNHKGVSSKPSGYSLCADPPAMQPKHPDYSGWFWDERIGKFWYVPGLQVASSDNCPNETASSVDDPLFRWKRILQFDPATGTYTDIADAGIGFNQTWWSVLDPVTNKIIRPWYSGSNGSNLDVFDIATNTWARKRTNFNAANGNIHLTKSSLAVDRESRQVYAIDHESGRLHRFSLDLPVASNGFYIVDDLGIVPGWVKPSTGVEPKIAWDPKNRVVLHACLWCRNFYAYHPDTKQWETLGAVADNGVQASGKTFFYDEVNGVFGWFGQSDPSPDLASTPYLFLYRYGPASGK
jgi:hypothetical protein